LLKLVFYSKLSLTSLYSEPCEWYRNYEQFCYLLHPNILDSTVLSIGSVLAAESTLPNNLATTNSTENCDGSDSSSPLLTTRDNLTVSIQPTTSNGQFPDRCQARVLIPGCGDSLLPFDMIQDGWTGGIVGVDFASNVIHQMQTKVLNSTVVSGLATKCSKKPKDILDFICADVTQPLQGYTSNSFDLILVKGTLDAILCSNASRPAAISFIRNCVRLLSPHHGVLLIITTGNPDNRLEYLEYKNELSYYWRNVSVHPLRNPNHSARNNQPQYVLKTFFICIAWM
jgi:2-polyprenyl-3-methyl-5-hydroxy-6-metoxy-1,4-benzoquinol methylase